MTMGVLMGIRRLWRDVASPAATRKKRLTGNGIAVCAMSPAAGASRQEIVDRIR